MGSFSIAVLVVFILACIVIGRIKKAGESEQGRSIALDIFKRFFR